MREKWTTRPACALLLMSAMACSPVEGPPIVPSIASPETSYLNSSSVIDRNNPAAVAGAATDIFFGKVVESMGSTERRGQLESQFSIEVSERLKGNAAGRVTVNQRGGVKDRTVVVESGDELLVLGQSYLIAARFSKDQDWYTLIPVAGDIPVTGNGSPRAKVNRPPENRDEVRDRMKDAIAREIPFAPSGATGTAPSKTPAPSSPSVPPQTSSPVSAPRPTS
ncbi:hypothetical protein [Nocardia suismassiliense]|uniref:hypothetical protein n=1 Tax=Nocardia suismassiliense TaxID=2077092 RepID=UPI000D1E90FF|nr:hypothetical protein [Nocardia suismassiliense]